MPGQLYTRTDTWQDVHGNIKKTYETYQRIQERKTTTTTLHIIDSESSVAVQMQGGCVSAHAAAIATFQAPAICHRAIATVQALAMCKAYLKAL